MKKNQRQEEINFKSDENLKDRGFKEMILNAIANFEYENIENLIISLLGVLSPMIPLVFLFRKDLVKSIDIIPLMIIIIVINCLLFTQLLTLTMIIKNIKNSVKRYYIENYCSKIAYLQSKLNLLSEKKNISEKKLIKKNLKTEKLLLKYKYKIKKYEEFTFNKSKSEQKRDAYRETLIINNLIGSLLIVAKALDYLGYKFTFKHAISLMLLLYFFIFIRGIFYDMVAFIYRKNSKFNEYRKNKIDTIKKNMDYYHKFS